MCSNSMANAHVVLKKIRQRLRVTVSREKKWYPRILRVICLYNKVYLALPRQTPSGCIVRQPFSPIHVSNFKYFSLVWPSSHWHMNWHAASSGWPKHPVMHDNTLMKERIQILHIRTKTFIKSYLNIQNSANSRDFLSRSRQTLMKSKINNIKMRLNEGTGPIVS